MYWNWERTIIVVILIVGALQMYRVNHRRAVEPSIGLEAPSYTYGNIVDSDIDIPPNDLVSYEIRLNRRARLVGRFWKVDLSSGVACTVIRAEDIEKWKAGESTPTFVSTGRVPGGKVYRQLEAGNYFLVISNHGDDKAALVHVNMTIE